MSDADKDNNSGDSKVVVYSTPTCGFCHMVKKYFDENDIQYRDIDISSDAQGYKDVLEKTGQLGVPVVDIDGIIVIGFDRPKIDAALKEKSIT